MWCHHTQNPSHMAESHRLNGKGKKPDTENYLLCGSVIEGLQTGKPSPRRRGQDGNSFGKGPADSGWAGSKGLSGELSFFTRCPPVQTH